MADLEKVSRELLDSALTKPDSQLQRRLPSEELEALGILLERTARRYPSQENGESMEEYLTDFEQLAVKYSLLKVEDAIAVLRIDPEQEFFPKPNEVAREIERQQLRKVSSHVYARG
jgi:hypothetical protein